VADELFGGSDFFDPNDLLQVKYEMLRRVRHDDFTVRQAAQLFGFSRPSFYQAQEAFTRGGLGALVPQKRGPRRAHKLSQQVMAFIERTIAADPGADLVAAVQQAFGISVHRRTFQ
jgi:transposase